MTMERNDETPRESRKTDWIVAIASVPVAASLAAACYVHLGTTGWFAGTAAAIAYAAMLAGNKLVRRSRRVEELRREVAVLQVEIDRLGGRIANDTGPMFAGPPREAMPSLAIEPRAAVGMEQPGFGRRKPVPETTTAPPAQPAAMPQSYDGLAPWPEMPVEPANSPGTVPAPTPAAVAPAAAAAAPSVPPSRAPASAAPNNPKNYERLQHLVKRLASEVDGPKATTPDPDRRIAPAQAQAQAPTSATAPASRTPAAMAQPNRARLGTATHSPDVARVIEAIEAERVDVYLDPIQSLDERKPRHFEVAVRFRDQSGQQISADVFDPVVRAAGLGPRIDLVKLPRAARVAERVQSRGRPSDVLATMSGDSLAEHSFIGQINGVLGAASPAGMVLSFSQADVRRFGRLHWETLATLSDMGLRFAVDHVTDLDMDFEALKARRFDFVKLDATVFLDGLPASDGYVSARDICRHFSAIGLALVIGQIANERELAEILGFGVLLGQGTLFGAPRPVRQDVLSRTEAA